LPRGQAELLAEQRARARAGVRLNADQFKASVSKHLSPTKRYCRSQPAELMAGIYRREEDTLMTKKVADQLAATLAAVGVKRVYGVVGDSLNSERPLASAVLR
jgi:hypothetical protein